jgi:hypothetical protein
LSENWLGQKLQAFAIFAKVKAGFPQEKAVTGALKEKLYLSHQIIDLSKIFTLQ